MMICMFKSCTKCGGDLAEDDGDWKCVQCAKYYYSALEDPAVRWGPVYRPLAHGVLGQETPVAVDNYISDGKASSGSSEPGDGVPKKFVRRLRSRAARSINSLIQAKSRGDDRWWARNRQLIEYLDRGLSVREISLLTNPGERQIRTVRERLVDSRAAN